jgi:hypothetical protein
MGKFEINLNTLLQLATIVGMVAGGAAIWTNTSRDIRDLQEWRFNHEQVHKDRLAEVKAIEAIADERFRNIEGEVRKIGNLEYRLTVSEQSTLSVVESVKALQEIVNRQGSDIRLALEILQRMESRVQAGR